MGFKIVAWKHMETGELQIETKCGPMDAADPARPLPWRHVYSEWVADAACGERRAEWLRTPEGRRALEKAVEADARGECACEDLLFSGPPPTWL